MKVTKTTKAAKTTKPAVVPGLTAQTSHVTVLLRGHYSGVHICTVIDATEEYFVVKDARRIWSWSGAATLSDLARVGPSQPAQCKMPAKETEPKLIRKLDICEILPVSPAAAHVLYEQVPVWSA